MNELAEIRRANLRAIIERDGLASAARRFGKPDRQIKDMEAGRKSFGEKVARSMERSYAPNRPPGWLDLAPGTLLTPDLPPPDTVRPEIADVVAAHIRPAKAATGQGTLLTLSPAEHALLDAARPLSDDDLALLEQIARRMAGEGSGPPMESREFLPPVPRLKKDKA